MTQQADPPEPPAKPDPRYQYGGADFQRASELLRALRARQLRPRVIIGGALPLRRVLRRLPRVSVSVSDSAAGDAIRSRLSERRLGVARNRFAHGVLVLPASAADYSRGRSRQAMRTNVTRAKGLGMTCEPIPEGERIAVIEAFLAGFKGDAEQAQREIGWWRELPDSHNQWWTVRDGSGAPAGVAVLIRDRETAVLRVLLGSSSEARWLLHTCVVESLCEAGVRHLLTYSPNALALDPGLQSFQRLLGYTVARLKLA